MGIFNLFDIYNKTRKMKIKINEEQYSKLVKSLQEAAPQANQPAQQPAQNTQQPSDSKAMVDAIANDPSMKQAFYKQPSLWNIMKSALKGEKRKGTGIVPAEDIIRQYGLTNLNKDIASIIKNFNFNKPVTYELLTNTITFPSSKQGAQPIVFQKNKKYSAVVTSPNVGDNYLVLTDGGAKVKIFIKSKNQKQPGRNVFDVVFNKMILDAQGKMVKSQINATIMIDSKKGSGYYDYKR